MPATSPSGTPTAVATTSVIKPSCSVTSSAPPMSGPTGWPRVQLMTRFPDTTLPNHARYCRQPGRSRPKNSRNARSAVGSLVWPSIWATTSPGTLRTRVKTITDARSAVTTDAASLCVRYLAIGVAATSCPAAANGRGLGELLRDKRPSESVVPARRVLHVVADLLAAYRHEVGAEQHDGRHRPGHLLLELEVDGLALGRIVLGPALVEEPARFFVLPIAEVRPFGRHAEVAIE